MNIFELFGTIAVDNGDANKKIGETSSKAKEFATAMKNGITTATKWGAGIAAAATAATAVILNKIKNIVSDTAQLADTIDKASARIGFSTQAYQEWEYVLALCGADVGTLESGMKALQEKMYSVNTGSTEAIRIFDELGISCYDLNGEMKDAEVIFEEIIYKLAEMTNESERTQLAQKIFSEGGVKLAAVLNSGTEGIDAMREAFHELGIEMDEEAIDAGVKYTDTVYTLNRAWTSVKNTIAIAVMPYITDFLEKLTKKIPDIKKKIEEWSPAIEKAAGSLMSGFEWLINNPQVITDTITNIYNGAKNVFDTVKAITDEIKTIWGYVQDIIDFLSPSAGNDAVAEWAKNNYGTNPEKPPLKEYPPGNAVGASTSAAASIFAATDSAEAIEESLTDAAEALEVAAETLSETEVTPDLAESAENNLQEDLNDMDLTVSVEPVLSGSGFFNSFAGGSYFRERASGYLGEIPGHAEGLDYVPHDNYVARLHKGEKVLTANEASAFRSGEGNTRVEAAVNRLGEIMNQVLSAIREGQVIQLETGALVGATAGAMNDRLGALAVRSGRRN